MPSSKQRTDSAAKISAGLAPSREAESRLDEQEAARIDRALRRLHESMRDFWSAWPLARRNPTQLSRELDIDRTTCQRLASLARDHFDQRAMLESMPGPRALRMLIDAALRADCPATAQVLAAFRSAVDGFDELLRDFGGSLSHLKRRMSSAPLTTASHSADHLDDRSPQESLFHAARHITGRHSQATASVGLYDAVGVKDGELRHVRMSGNFGMVAQPNAVPMVLEAFEGVGTGSSDGWQRTPQLIENMTSAEWTSVELRPSAGFASRAVEIARSQTPADVYIYTAFPVAEPTTRDEPVEESWFILNSPTAALIFDLYLHESVARRCLVTMDIHLWQASFANYPHGRWHTRMPQTPTLVQLGRGIGHCDSSLHPRHRELTEALFERAAVNPQHYIAFRCEERYPLWRLGYRYELDFGRSES